MYSVIWDAICRHSIWHCNQSTQPIIFCIFEQPPRLVDLLLYVAWIFLCGKIAFLAT